MQDHDTTADSDDKSGDRALLPHPRAELAKSGLSDETIAANKIFSESDAAAVAKLLNWSVERAKLLGPVLVYPHLDRVGNPIGHATIKPDCPRDREDKPGEVIKYENPRGQPNRAYIPAGTRASLSDPTTVIFLTEGT